MLCRGPIALDRANSQRHRYTGHVQPRWLSWFAVVAAALAAWGGARWAWCLPLLWVGTMVATLALRPEQRSLLSRFWALAGLCLLGLAWLVAKDHELALRHTLTFVLAALLFALARRAAPGDRQVQAIALAIAATALVGFLQVAGGFDEVREGLDMLAPGQRRAAYRRLEFGRVFGTATLPGHFAILVLMAAPLLLSGLQRASRWGRAARLTGIALVAASLVMARSVAALAVAMVLLALAGARGLPRRRLVLVGVAILGVAALVAVSREDLRRAAPLRLRLVNWQTAAWVFANHPAVGVGLGGIGQAGLVSPQAPGNITHFAHNTPLQLLAELGVAGLPVVVAGFVALLVLLRRGLQTEIGLALAVAVLPLHNLVDFSAYAPEVLLPWAVLAGTLTARVVPEHPPPLPSLVLLPVLVVGLTLQSLEWIAEVGASAAATAPTADRVRDTLAATRWTPWRLTPVQAVVDLTLSADVPRELIVAVDNELARRHWVRPLSSSWAEGRARLRLRLGDSREALVWVREARRRAPHRAELVELEAACRAER